VAIVKRIIAKNRSVVASLLVGWLLLCGMMLLMAVDMSMDMNMGMDDTAVSMSHHYGASSLGVDEAGSVGINQHCCDVIDDSVLVAQHQFTDLFFDLSLIVVVCSFFFLWGMATGRTNIYYYFFIPPSGPPLHQRLCVWLD
jgi:hypothetical protein